MRHGGQAFDMKLMACFARRRNAAGLTLRAVALKTIVKSRNKNVRRLVRRFCRMAVTAFHGPVRSMIEPSFRIPVISQQNRFNCPTQVTFFGKLHRPTRLRGNGNHEHPDQRRPRFSAANHGRSAQPEDFGHGCRAGIHGRQLLEWRQCHRRKRRIRR